jgi:hypothetical protein
MFLSIIMCWVLFVPVVFHHAACLHCLKYGEKRKAEMGSRSIELCKAVLIS